jgi:serine/threonine protein kinase
MYLPQGTKLHNRYVIEGLLGHGGFGITYAAHDKTLNVRVAVKEYLPRQLATRAEGQTKVSVFTGEARQQYDYGLRKFLEEAQSVARFSHHPNIVSARDYFEANGTAYMVMEYVEGVTLKEYLEKKGGRISFEEAKGIMMPVMDALREVHQAGMLHRDVSPDNIYITTSAQVKILDFGAARYFAGEQSKSLSVILKPGYAPEEQYRSSGKQGSWTDVYSVGATIYKALTGQTPPDALDRKEEDTLAPPSRLGVNIPPPAEQALLQALAVNAGRRFHTMGEFQQALLGNAAVTRGFQPAPEPSSAPGVAPVATPPPVYAPPSAQPSHYPQVPRRSANPAAIAAAIGLGIVGLLLVVILIIKVTVPPSKTTAKVEPGGQENHSQQQDAQHAKEFLESGVTYLKAKDYEKARVVLEKAIQLDPKKVEAYLELSRAFIGLKRRDEAIKASKEVLKLDAKNVAAYYLLGVVCSEQGRYQEGMDYLKTALTYNPNFAPAQTYLGYAYANLGNMDKAREMYLILEKQDKEKAEKLLIFINMKAMEKKAPPAGVGSIDYMQLLKAQVKSIKLFETGKEAIPPQKRVYSNRFLKSATRFVAFEIKLSYPKPNRRIDFPVKSVWRHNDGSLIREQYHQGRVEPNWPGSLQSNGLGNAEYGAYWPAGDYRVDIYIGDKKIGSQAFQVVER